MCIKRILKKDGYVRRKPIKCLAIGESKYRAEQFRIVLFLIAVFNDMEHNPILSIDTKKKEPLGKLTRNEQVLTKKDQIPEVFSSDYSFLANGRAIPQAIYDVKLNKGYISIGNSYETADFIIDNLRWWWLNFGQYHYQDATNILILSDCGGANSYRHHRFKVLLQKLAKEINIKIVMAHYPPYCSKYNPIERRLFSQVHRTIKNTILMNLRQVKELMSKTSTSTGLTVQVRIVDKLYPLKMPSNKEDIDEKRILRHPVLPQFSYTILP
jgi:Rhodopirellula transposase.